MSPFKEEEPVLSTSRRPFGVRTAAAAVLKLSVALGLVAYLVRRGDIAWPVLQSSLTQWHYTIPAVIFIFISPLCQLWRWQSLLRASRVHLPTLEVFCCVMVSKFLNMLLPGYIGGDVLRGLYVSRRATGTDPASGDLATSVPRSAVVPSIVFDRVGGLVPLLVFCIAGSLSASYDTIPKNVIVPVVILCAGGLAGALGFFLLAYRMPKPPQWLARLSGKVRAEGFVSTLFQSSHLYVRNTSLMATILGVSIVSQGATVFSVLLLGRSLGLHLPTEAYFALVPLGLMVTAIPISPAGLGVGQVAFLALFHVAGTTQGANLFTLYMACCVVVNIGGAFLLPSLHLGAPERTARTSREHDALKREPALTAGRQTRQ